MNAWQSRYSVTSYLSKTLSMSTDNDTDNLTRADLTKKK